MVMMDEKYKRVRDQALLLARENKRAEPGIKKVYWFPHEVEVRLIELEDELPHAVSGVVEPFYFSASRADNLDAPTGVALIRSDEFRRLSLPEDWGDWDKAQELEI